MAELSAYRPKSCYGRNPMKLLSSEFPLFTRLAPADVNDVATWHQCFIVNLPNFFTSIEQKFLRSNLTSNLNLKCHLARSDF